MPGYKLQRNPSTLKLLRNSATGKLMRYESNPYAPYNCECFDSGKAPLYYTLVISGVTPCPGEPNLNGTKRLTQFGSGLPCTWQLVEGSNIWQLTTKNAYTAVWVREVGITDWYYWVGSGCVLSANNIANLCTECNGSSGHYPCTGYGGIASWCQGWNPGGCS